MAVGPWQLVHATSVIGGPASAGRVGPPTSPTSFLPLLLRMLPIIQSLASDSVMVNSDVPQAPLPVARTVTVPALRAEISVPPRATSFCRSAIALSDRPQVMVDGSTLPTTAGTWNWWVPSN